MQTKFETEYMVCNCNDWKITQTMIGMILDVTSLAFFICLSLNPINGVT